jgi:hypothetical protein
VGSPFRGGPPVQVGGGGGVSGGGDGPIPSLRAATHPTPVLATPNTERVNDIEIIVLNRAIT